MISASVFSRAAVLCLKHRNVSVNKVYMHLLLSADFFLNKLFQENFSGTKPESNGLDLGSNVCKGYQLTKSRC